MKRLRFPLHIQILLGLVLGAVFGGIFHIDTHKITISHEYASSMQSVDVTNWDEVILSSAERTRAFGPEDQNQIVGTFEKMRDKSKIVTVAVRKAGEVRDYQHVESIEKDATIATVIKPLGDVFIRLLMMIAIPLVFASLLVGVASLKDFKKMARIGGKTIAIYITTTALAITIGLVIGNVIQPGTRMDPVAQESLMSAYQEDAAANIDRNLDIDLLDYMVNIVPRNPISAMANTEMLQIIFFALMFGIAAVMLPDDKRLKITGFFDAVSDTMVKMVEIIMLFAPIGVFALISATIGEFGFGVLQTLIWYIVAVIAGLLIQIMLVYPLLLKTLARRFSIKEFFRKLRPAQLVAFTTSSSAATLPVTYECVDEMGAPKSISSFVLPLGATINMDGTALYQGVAALFIAQVYGLDLGIFQQLTIVLTAILASIGTAPVPGVGIVMLIIILKAVGIPEEGIALILGVDRILDMMRTVVNVTGDSAVTIAVTSTENAFGEPVSPSPNR
jgi:Na+/H+-dicarboxylate symporter